MPRYRAKGSPTAKTASFSLRTSGCHLPGGCTHQPWAARQSRGLGASPRESPSPWVGGEKSFRDLAVIPGGMKASLGKPICCKQKGKNLLHPPSFPVNHSVKPDEGPCWDSCLVPQLCRGTCTLCPSQLPWMVSRLLLQRNPCSSPCTSGQ